MRLPVPRNRLVTLTILASVLTLAVTVGLAYPSLIPGTGPPQDADVVLADSNPSSTIEEAPAASTDASTSTAAAATPDAGDARFTPEGAPSTAAPPPTPNPNFTPAVQTTTGGSGGFLDHDGEHEGKHEEEHEEDEEHEREEHEDEWEDD